jgi:hypothetical protein
MPIVPWQQLRLGNTVLSVSRHLYLQAVSDGDYFLILFRKENDFGHPLIVPHSCFGVEIR